MCSPTSRLTTTSRAPKSTGSDRSRTNNAGLRATGLFAGSELNVDGAVHLVGRLRLFGRGNGAALGDIRPVNATCEIEWAALRAHMDDVDRVAPPVPADVVQYELGAIGTSALTFTDATLGWDSGGARTVLYSAAAEASPDVTRDGAVAGSAIGVIEERDGDVHARWAQLLDHDGHRLALKAEGLVVARGAPGTVLVVVDVDSHHLPSELLEVRLDGPWPGLSPCA